jgi:hypothetical protein
MQQAQWTPMRMELFINIFFNQFNDFPSLSNPSDELSKQPPQSPSTAQAGLLYSLVNHFVQICHEHPCFDFGR